MNGLGASTKLNLFMIHVKRFIKAVLSGIADFHEESNNMFQRSSDPSHIFNI